MKYKQEKIKSDKNVYLILNIFLVIVSLSMLLSIILLVSLLVGDGVFITRNMYFLVAIIISGLSILFGIFWMRLFRSYELGTFINRIENPCMLGFIMLQCRLLARTKGWDEDIEEIGEYVKKNKL